MLFFYPSMDADLEAKEVKLEVEEFQVALEMDTLEAGLYDVHQKKCLIAILA